FRRLNLMLAVTEAVRSADSEELAVVNAQTMLRARLGWNSDSAFRTSVFEQFRPVVLAAFREGKSESKAPASDVHEDLAAFELWDAETWSAAFWNLFENPMPDTPRVDF